MKGRWAAIGLAALLVLGIAGDSPAKEVLVADLSNHLIAITTGFTGTEVVLFGTIGGLSLLPKGEDPGSVAVVVRGPSEGVKVRRKERLGGIWVNRRSMEFGHVPSFYQVALSLPNNAVNAEKPDLSWLGLSPVELMRNEVGVENLPIEAAPGATPEDIAIFKAALIRNRQTAGLYGRNLGLVDFIGERLFRTTINFPANVPTGTYSVSVLLVKGGEVISAQTVPLQVSKIGFSADLFYFAHHRSTLYASLSVAAALLAGWLAGLLFRKV